MESNLEKYAISDTEYNETTKNAIDQIQAQIQEFKSKPRRGK